MTPLCRVLAPSIQTSKFLSFGAAITVALNIALTLSHAACEEAPTVKGPAVKGPVVREPVKPKSSDVPPQDLTPAPQWKPGDPVRVKPRSKDSSQSPRDESAKDNEKKDRLNDQP